MLVKALVCPNMLSAYGRAYSGMLVLVTVWFVGADDDPPPPLILIPLK
jgi:hypothetical protein